MCKNQYTDTYIHVYIYIYIFLYIINHRYRHDCPLMLGQKQRKSDSKTTDAINSYLDSGMRCHLIPQTACGVKGDSIALSSRVSNEDAKLVSISSSSSIVKLRQGRGNTFSESLRAVSVVISKNEEMLPSGVLPEIQNETFIQR